MIRIKDKHGEVQDSSPWATLKVRRAKVFDSKSNSNCELGLVGTPLPLGGILGVKYLYSMVYSMVVPAKY